MCPDSVYEQKRRTHHQRNRSDEEPGIAPVIKEILKKYNLKGSLAISDHMKLVLNIKSGAIDFISERNTNTKAVCERRGDTFIPTTKDYISICENYFHETFVGTTADCLNELYTALKGDEYVNEDVSQTDYFYRSHFIEMNIGKWDKPYVLVK